MEERWETVAHLENLPHLRYIVRQTLIRTCHNKDFLGLQPLPPSCFGAERFIILIPFLFPKEGFGPFPSYFWPYEVAVFTSFAG